MPAPLTSTAFLELVRKSGVAEPERLEGCLTRLQSAGLFPDDPRRLAALLVREGLLTYFQVSQLLLGKWRGFTLGKYRVLEHLGAGGMGSVFLCEHLSMCRRVAIKVLPTLLARDPENVGRFQREAQAVAALDHPNIVHAYDLCHEGNLHFLVMEYVEGVSLEEIVRKSGPLALPRAAHYLSQAAWGLEHAHAAGLVHRDIKPSNLLVNRAGVVKILDLGLARFFRNELDAHSPANGQDLLGTVDYLAPEQALDCHTTDIRADIYSLGATFYFLLTGSPPFGKGTARQKLLRHQLHPLPSIREAQPDLPEAFVAVLEKMLAKEPTERYQVPGEVLAALAPWTVEPAVPPSSRELARLSPAAKEAAFQRVDVPVVKRARKRWEILAPAEEPEPNGSLPKVPATGEWSGSELMASVEAKTSPRLPFVSWLHRPVYWAMSFVLLAVAVGLIALTWSLVLGNAPAAAPPPRMQPANPIH